MASRIWVKPQHPYLPQLPPAVHDSQQMLTISVSLKGFCECSIATGQQASRTHWCKSTSLHDSQRTRISWRETKAEETREIPSASRAYYTLILELSIIYRCYLISATSALLGFCVSPHSQRLTTHTHMDESQITVMADDFESKELRGLARCHDGWNLCHRN